MSFKKNLRLIFFYIFLIFLIGCDKKINKQSTDKVIAKIGDRIITVNDFVNRSELNIRPPYCRGNDSLSKKIILNSLIAEKLLALEAEKNDDLARDKRFKLFLKGRKEQAMRHWLYYNDFYKKINIDSNEIKTAFRLYGRKYNIMYFDIRDSIIANYIAQKLKQGVSFTKLFNEIYGNEKIPLKEVSWNSSEHQAIHDALFSKPLKKGQIIGPIKIENNFYLMIKIIDWTDKNVLSNYSVEKRLLDIKRKLRENKALTQFEKYVQKIMKGKKIEFSKDVFYKLSEVFYSKYMSDPQQRKSVFDIGFLNKHSNNGDKLEVELKNFKEAQLLKIDDQIWTVDDLINEINSHPLVFRKKRIKKSEFPQQLKLAIADLIRDKYITHEAYKKKYDRLASVLKEVEIWKDFYYSLHQRNNFLRSKGMDNIYSIDSEILEKYLNPYVFQLQKEYNDKILVNLNVLDEIQLTTIEMIILKPNVPYPVIMPPIPILTNRNVIDYGQRIDQN